MLIVFREFLRRPETHLPKVYISLRQAREHRLKWQIKSEGTYLLKNVDDLDQYIQMSKQVWHIPENQWEDYL